MISIVIINFNTFEITCNCINSIIEHSSGFDYEIILVDNASSECDPELFLKYFTSIKLVKSHVNLGFSKGNNLGIRNASGEYILLLNSDTYFIENSLKSCLQRFSAVDNIGFLGIRMNFPNGVFQHSARRFRSISWEILDVFRFLLFFLPYKNKALLMLGKYFRGDFDVHTDWLSGAFLMFRKEILYKLPGHILDERFFMYGEDHLWCWQIQSLGYHNYFYSGTSIVHINNASTDPHKRLRLLRIMFNHELEIMRARKGSGLYYWFFIFLYGAKENFRILYKHLIAFLKPGV
jgi:GT2 family glycosyltransferase